MKIGHPVDRKTRLRRKNRYGYIEGLLSIIANLILFGLKYWAGIVTGSLALMADAWHTLSDSVSSFIVVGSVKLSSRKADRKHPFGHGRYQQIAALFIAFLLGIIAYEFFTEALEKFRNRESTHFGAFAIAVTSLSLVVKEGLAQYAFRAYRKTGYETLRADGWHHRSDGLSSLAILIGILIGNRFWWMDSVLGLIVSLMLFYAVFEIIRDSVDKLLGEQPNEKLVSEIKQLIQRTTHQEIHPHHFHLHVYGEHREITFHIKLDGSRDLNEAHDIASSIEDALREEMDMEATIHIEPHTVSRDHP
ncbi:MAG: cation diffusion facilitator family transporter [Bacteroidales bacterium]